MARRKRGNPIHGWVNFDKPLGMTSTQAVGKVRWLYGGAKGWPCGHARSASQRHPSYCPRRCNENRAILVEARKTYICGVKWGERTDTLDVEGDIVVTSDVRPSDDEIDTVLPAFIGKIQQAPPAFSAIKSTARELMIWHARGSARNERKTGGNRRD